MSVCSVPQFNDAGREYEASRAAVTTDAEPLSDDWFDELDRLHKQSGEYGWHGQGVDGAEEAWSEAIDEAYPTIRARVRELQRQVEAARTALRRIHNRLRESASNETNPWAAIEDSELIAFEATTAALAPQTGEVGS